MTDLHVYGASDDLIEIEGAVRDELNPPYGKPAEVYVSANKPGMTNVNVVFGMEYDPDGTGEWRITHVHDPYGIVTITHARGEDEGNDEHGCPGYSDKATILGGFSAQLVTEYEK